MTYRVPKLDDSGKLPSKFLPPPVDVSTKQDTATLGAAVVADATVRATFGSLRNQRGSIAARRQLTRDTLTQPVAATPPTVVISQGNQAHSGVYYPSNHPAISYRGAVISHVTAVAATSPVAGDAQTAYFAKPAITSPAGGNTPVYRAEVMCDATTVALCYLGTSAPKYRIFVDGQLITYSAAPTGGTITGSGTPFSPANSLLQATTANYFGDGKLHWARLTFAAKATRRITFEAGTGTQFGGVVVGATNALSAGYPDGFKAMFLGDSYTAGTGADNIGTGFASVACHLLGWTLYQMGAGGSGYLATGTSGSTLTIPARLAADVIPANPDLIVLAAGINDASNTTADISAAVTSTLATLRSGLPNTPVAVVGAWQPTSSPGAGLTAANAAILTAAAAAPNVVKTIDPTGWFKGAGKVGATTSDGPADYLISSDGTHPTQAGHEWIGPLLARELASVGA